MLRFSEYEFLLSKEDRVQIAVGTMKRWEVLVQRLSGPRTDPKFHEIALFVVAGQDKKAAIENVYKEKRLRELINTLSNLRILVRLHKPIGSDIGYTALNKAAEPYYYSAESVRV